MKRYRVRVLAVIIGIFVLMLTFSGCSIPFSDQQNSYKSESTEKTKVQLRFVNSWGGNDSKADALQMVFDKFMKDHPGIEVVNEALFGDDFLPKLKTDFASGNDPDVFGLWPGSDIKVLIKAGKVADLTDILEKDKAWKNDFGSGMWAYTTFDNRIYGLPVEIVFECLFVNKDIFEEYHVKIPETYEELKTAVAVLKSHNIVPIAYNSFSEGTYIYQNIVAMLGGKNLTESPFNNGKVDSCFIDAMHYMKELYQSGAFPKEAFTMKSKDRNVLFKNKRAAMIVQGSWFIGELGDDRTVEIIPFPSLKEGNAPYSSLIYGLGCGTFYMSKSASNTDNKREPALKLLKALTSKESAAIFAQQTGMISNVNIEDYNINYNALTQRGQELIHNAKQLIGPPDSFVYRSVWENIIVKQFPYILEGKQTAEEVWSKALKAGAAGS